MSGRACGVEPISSAICFEAQAAVVEPLDVFLIAG